MLPSKEEKIMIQITNEMKQAGQRRLEEVEKQVDYYISRAVKDGSHTAYFACDRDRDGDVYDEIRKRYEQAGYIIKPTGYIGGVYQRTEDIIW
jgi:hypothetical protein